MKTFVFVVLLSICITLVSSIHIVDVKKNNGLYPTRPNVRKLRSTSRIASRTAVVESPQQRKPKEEEPKDDILTEEKKNSTGSS